MKRSNRSRGIFITSGSYNEVEKYSWLHNQRRTDAIVSEKVACGLGYQAAPRTESCHVANSGCASNVTMEYSPNRQGVVRAIALSDH
jgi:hypothetical protein